MKPTIPATAYMPIILQSKGDRLMILVKRCTNIHFQTEYRCMCPSRFKKYVARGFTLEDAVRLMMFQIDVLIDTKANEKYP
jgi:hypothetical protein